MLAARCPTDSLLKIDHQRDISGRILTLERVNGQSVDVSRCWYRWKRSIYYVDRAQGLKQGAMRRLLASVGALDRQISRVFLTYRAWGIEHARIYQMAAAAYLCAFALFIGLVCAACSAAWLSMAMALYTSASTSRPHRTRHKLATGHVLCPKCTSLATKQQQARHRQILARHQTKTSRFGVVGTTASSKASTRCATAQLPA